MNRKHYDRVIWREGMLISPQHLQQQELFQEQSLHERLAASTPLSWGAQAIEFDAGALKSGRLELTRFEAVTPDINGEYETDVARAQIALEPQWFPAVENRGEGLFVQLRAEAVKSWLARPTVKQRLDVLASGRLNRTGRGVGT